MPEGDVVKRTAARLHAALAGRELVRAELRWPSLATADLTGRTVTEVLARGKHVLTRLDGGRPGVPDEGVALTLRSHLRMDGSWHVHATGRSWASTGRGRDEHRVRAVLANEEWTAVGHRLGMLDLVRTDREDTLVGHLGPDVLGPDWAPGAVLATLRARPDRAVGEALLDQTVLAGVGTFYMSEVLFLRGTSPWTPVRDVAGLDAVVDLVHRLMSANEERVAQVTTGDARPGHEKWVHGRSGRPCRRCGTTVRVALIGPETKERTAFFCPRCQPGPAPTDDGRPQRPLGSSRGGRRGPELPSYRRH